jgi:hypothetical protein
MAKHKVFLGSDQVHMPTYRNKSIAFCACGRTGHTHLVHIVAKRLGAACKDCQRTYDYDKLDAHGKWRSIESSKPVDVAKVPVSWVPSCLKTKMRVTTLASGLSGQCTH